MPEGLPHKTYLLGKKERAGKRLKKMKEEECIICMIPMGEEDEYALETYIFMKTPCSHKFHKKCLLDWIKQK